MKFKKVTEDSNGQTWIYNSIFSIFGWVYLFFLIILFWFFFSHTYTHSTKGMSCWVINISTDYPQKSRWQDPILPQPIHEITKSTNHHIIQTPPLFFPLLKLRYSLWILAQSHTLTHRHTKKKNGSSNNGYRFNCCGIGHFHPAFSQEA